MVISRVTINWVVSGSKARRREGGGGRGRGECGNSVNFKNTMDNEMWNVLHLIGRR